MYKGKLIGVVVPAHNEAEFVGEVVQTMPAFVDRIFVVNDASSDGTAGVLAGLSDPRLTVIQHPARQGAGGAMLSGYRRALAEGLDVAAIMAGDGQMDPALLPQMLEPVVTGRADYAKGNRLVGQARQGMPALRLFGNTLVTYIIKVASGYWHLDDPLNGYTAISRLALSWLDLKRIERGYAFESDLLIKLGAHRARVVNVPMPARYRNEKSEIVYLKFAFYTSWVILRDYLWRLWATYFRFRAAVPEPEVKARESEG